MEFADTFSKQVITPDGVSPPLGAHRVLIGKTGCWNRVEDLVIGATDNVRLEQALCAEHGRSLVGTSDDLVLRRQWHDAQEKIQWHHGISDGSG